MQSQVSVVQDEQTEWVFALDAAMPMTNAEGRDWLDAQFVQLGSEPLRPTGKLQQFTIARRNPPGGMACAAGGFAGWKVIWIDETPGTARRRSTSAGSIDQRRPCLPNSTTL